MDVIDPYKELPFAKNGRIKITSNAPFTPTYVTSHLTQTSDPASIYADRVQNRQIMLENPARESRIKEEEREKQKRRDTRKARKRLGVVGTKEAKERGFWNFDKTQITFRNILPLHHLWMGYMSELLGLAQPSSATPGALSKPPMPTSATMHAKLLKADFHGAFVRVHQSKNVSVLGLSGIVIVDTENTFTVVTRQNRVKMIPKQNSIFTFTVPLYDLSKSAQFSVVQTSSQNELRDADMLTVLDIPHIEFKLHGNQFRFRSADRANRKFKHKETVEL
ncbi:hypothetical protein APHAL10511_004550 [Amanita phalloides]|nr:hypothetical protein APHAL10511_004550 [Amanita phalloides]